jgi:hypothetical protein
MTALIAGATAENVSKLRHIERICRGASRSALGRFTNRPYSWHDELMGSAETVSDVRPAEEGFASLSRSDYADQIGILALAIITMSMSKPGPFQVDKELLDFQAAAETD